MNNIQSYLMISSILFSLGIFGVITKRNAIAILMGIYLLGKIQLPHDTKLEIIGVPRLIMSMICLSFGLYLSTGLFGQPIHGLIDSYLPPDFSYAETKTSTLKVHKVD